MKQKYRYYNIMGRRRKVLRRGKEMCVCMRVDRNTTQG